MTLKKWRRVGSSKIRFSTGRPNIRCCSRWPVLKLCKTGRRLSSKVNRWMHNQLSRGSSWRTITGWERAPDLEPILISRLHRQADRLCSHLIILMFRCMARNFYNHSSQKVERWAVRRTWLEVSSHMDKATRIVNMALVVGAGLLAWVQISPTIFSSIK